MGSSRRYRPVLLALAFAAGSVAIAPAPAAAAPSVEVDTPSRPAHQVPRLESSLQDDARARVAGSLDAAAEDRGAGSVTVVVEAVDPAAARAAVHAAEGTVEIEAGGLVEAEVPRSALAGLATSPGVRLVREPRRPVADSVSEGVASIGASAWHENGWTGTGVKVAVLDVGFLGYESRLANELPGGTPADLDRCEEPGDTGHGTAVAEIVHDVAPTASLLLICIDSDVGFIDALDSLPSDVKIVNGSFSFTLTGRGDGTGPIAAAVARARARGVLYVASSGNYGTRHFHTAAKGDVPGDVNNDFVNISPDDWLSFTVPAHTIAFVAVQWDGWPTTTQDFDVYLFRGESLIDSSTFDQTVGAEPVELVKSDTFHSEPTTYRILVNRYRGTATPRIDFFFDGVSSVEHTSASSVTEPASSPAALAVGAHCVNTGAVETFSGRGPSIDGRTKPDLIAPDGTSGSVYGPNTSCTGEEGFLGTSAASPHVAGAAAVLLGASPALDVAELQQLLIDRAQDAGTSGPDNTYGAGRLRMGSAGSANVAIPRAFSPRSPVRLFDSRPGLVGASEVPDRTLPLGPGGKVKVPVGGVAGVPADATAVVLNVTAVAPTTGGYLTVHPGGTVPNASNLNFAAQQTVAVHVTATVGSDDTIEMFNATGNTHVVVDLTGWYGPTGASGPAADLLHTLAAPARAIDTRPGFQGYTEAPGDVVAPVGAGSAIPVAVAGAGGVPAQATAVVMNVTGIQPTVGTYLTAYPDGSPEPDTSTLNLPAGQVVANLVILPVGTDGAVRFRNNAGSAHLVVDVIGWFAPGAGGSGYVALDPPTRDLDTRTGTGLRRTPLGPNGTHKVAIDRYDGVPADAAAVMLGVVAVAPSTGGYLTVYPGTQSVPGSSTLNFAKGATTPNAVLTGIGTDGTVAFRNATGTVNVISDLFGFFLAPSAVPVPLADPPPPPPPLPGRIDLADWHPPVGAVPATGSVLYVSGDIGEPNTHGRETVNTLANSDMAASWGGGGLYLEVTAGPQPYWYLTLSGPDDGPPSDPLVVGEYSSEDGASFLLHRRSGEDCSFGDSRFIVDEVTITNNVLESVTVRFQFQCNGHDTMLRGLARWDADDPTVPPPPPPPSTLTWQPPAGSTPASGSYLYLSGFPGGPLVTGGTVNFSEPWNFGLEFSGTYGYRLVFSGPRPRTGIALGYYADVEENPALGRFFYSGPLPGACMPESHSVAIDAYSYAAGQLQSVTGRFVLLCAGSSTPHRGKFRFVQP